MIFPQKGGLIFSKNAFFSRAGANVDRSSMVLQAVINLTKKKPECR